MIFAMLIYYVVFFVHKYFWNRRQRTAIEPVIIPCSERILKRKLSNNIFYFHFSENILAGY